MPSKSKSKSKRRNNGAPPTALSMINRAEEKALYLLIGKRSIKRIARKTIGSEGGKLVEQFYELFQCLLGKKEGKKFIKTILKIACEIAILVIHRKMPESALDEFGKSIHYQFGQLMEFPTQLRNRYKPQEVVLANLRTTLAYFTRMLGNSFVELVDGYSRDQTVDRIRDVSSMLRKKDNLDLIFNRKTAAYQVSRQICKTIVNISRERPEFRYGVVRTTYHMKQNSLI